jgi:hypothetical protein
MDGAGLALDASAFRRISHTNNGYSIEEGWRMPWMARFYFLWAKRFYLLA